MSSFAVVGGSTDTLLTTTRSVRWAPSAHQRRMTNPSPQVLIRGGVTSAATLPSRFSDQRRDPAPGATPRFEPIRLATIDLDGAIAVVHPFARDECETPAMPAIAERLHDRRTR